MKKLSPIVVIIAALLGLVLAAMLGNVLFNFLLPQISEVRSFQGQIIVLALAIGSLLGVTATLRKLNFKPAPPAVAAAILKRHQTADIHTSKSTVCHEVGHTLGYLNYGWPVTSLAIVGMEGQALDGQVAFGHVATQITGDDEKYHRDRREDPDYLWDHMHTLLAGYMAERVVGGEIEGACCQQDLAQFEKVARDYLAWQSIQKSDLIWFNAPVTDAEMAANRTAIVNLQQEIEAGLTAFFHRNMALAHELIDRVAREKVVTYQGEELAALKRRVHP